MNVPRAPVIWVAVIAAGAAGRVSFERLFENTGEKPRASPASVQKPVSSPNANPPPTFTGPRPDSAVVLSASGASRLRLLVEWLSAAGEDELPAMAGELVKPAEKDGLPIRLLMTRWAEVNPKSLLAWAEGQVAGARQRNFYVESAIEAWARADFDGAWAAANSSHRQCRADALKGLASVNPERCLALLSADPSLLHLNATRDSNWLKPLISQLASENPQGVAALVDKADISSRNHIAGTLAKAWVESDPPAAVTWMKSLPGTAFDRSLQEAAEWIAIHAPDQTPVLLEGLPTGQLRACIENAEFTRTVAQDPVAARKMIDEMAPGIPRQHARVVLMQNRLEAGDFETAREMATQIGWRVESDWFPSSEHMVTSDGESGHSSGEESKPANDLATLFTHIAAADPKEAAAILALPRCDSYIATGAAVADPAGMATILTTLAAEKGWALDGSWDAEFRSASGSGGPTVALQTALRVWVSRDVNAAADWVGAQPAEAPSTPALRDLLFESWAQSDPEAMLAWSLRHEGTAEKAWSEAIAVAGPEVALSRVDEFLRTAGDDAITSVVRDLDPHSTQARDMLRDLPDAAGHASSAARPIMRSWLEENPEEASAWVKSLPAGEKQTSATAEIVSWACASKDFDTALRWAQTVPDADVRVLLVNLTNLLKENPDQVEARDHPGPARIRTRITYPVHK